MHYWYQGMWLKNQNQLTIHIFCLYFDADRLFRYVFVSCVEWAVLVKNNVVLFFAQLRLHGETRCRILAGLSTGGYTLGSLRESPIANRGFNSSTDTLPPFE